MVLFEQLHGLQAKRDGIVAEMDAEKKGSPEVASLRKEEKKEGKAYGHCFPSCKWR